MTSSNFQRKLYARLRNRLALMDRSHTVRMLQKAPLASFTFDDFPASAYETGGRMLEAAGVKGSYFVSGCFMGQNSRGLRMYEEGHLKAVYAAGHEIGCHTFSHTKLGSCPPEVTRKACDENAQFVRTLLGPEVEMTSFSYPVGDVSIPSKAELARRFRLCRGVRPSLNSGKIDLAQVHIVSLEMRHNPLQTLKRRVAEAVARKAWMVFLTHDVSEAPSPYGSTPAIMEYALRLLKEAGIQILTLKEAGDRILGEI
jgi:peptidoglycan/xylan/chitin deacetylase (PgdA/CDA1 family)